MKKLKRTAFVFSALIALLCVGCGYGELDAVKDNAETTFSAAGYSITGYQGYGLGLVIPFTSYGGAYVWYELENGNGVKYEAAVQSWGGEYHIYSLSAVDAIKP